MFGFLNKENYQSHPYKGVEFNNQIEFELFKKYLDLGEKHGWVTVEDDEGVPGGMRNRRFTSKLYINGIKNVYGEAYRYSIMGGWDGHTFDILKNKSAIQYIWITGLRYVKEQKEIADEELRQEREREEIELRNKRELELIQKYSERLNELNGTGNEFTPHFKIIGELESLAKKNEELLGIWNANVDKIYKLRSDFYTLNQ